MPRTKPIACLFVGDLHTGGDTAIAPREFYLQSKDRVYTLSVSQEALLLSWVSMARDAKERAKGHDLALMLGGDLIDGPMHHGTAQTSGTAGEARRMALELLEPLANAASAIYSVDGTDAHTGGEGGEGDDDNSIAHALGAEYRPHWRMEIGGAWLDWRHDGIHVSQRPHLEDNALIRAAQDEYLRSLMRGWPQAALVVRHHVHRSPPPVTIRGTTAALCGCWQMPTHWAAKHFSGTPDIGALLWFPGERRLERLLYEQA